MDMRYIKSYNVLKNHKAELFNEFFNMDSAAETKSIKKLAMTNPDVSDCVAKQTIILYFYVI